MTTWMIAPERFCGRAALPLTGTGRQAAATAAFIRSAWPEAAALHEPDGPLCRYGSCHCRGARRPAEALAGLNDIDYGAWQVLTREEAAALWPAEVETWYRAPHLVVILQGECR